MGVYNLLMVYKQYTKVTNRMYKHLETGKLFGLTKELASNLNLKSCGKIKHEKSEYDIFLGYKYIITENSLKKALSQSHQRCKDLIFPEITKFDVDQILLNFKEYNQYVVVKKRVKSVYWESKHAEQEVKRMEFQEKMKKPAYANAVKRNANKSAWAKKHRLEKMYDMTSSEKKVWDYINNSKLKKYGFEPQVDFSIQGHLYFGDFVSKRCRLVIEVDGGYHSTRETQKKMI